MLQPALEALVERATQADAGADLARAREAFEALTGPFSAGEPWYEQRIRFFFDWYLCEWDGGRVARRFASEGDPVAHACLRAARGLYEVLEVEGGLRLRDLLGGARYRITGDTTEELRPADVFDGRLVVVAECIYLAPGLVFHPAEAREPLDGILARVQAEPHDRIEVLDGLLRMRMRLDRFTNIKARHVYRYEALEDRDILSAAWAKSRAGKDAISTG